MVRTAVRHALRPLASVVLSALVLGGCGAGEPDRADSKEPTTTLPAECQSEVSPSDASPECQSALFASLLDSGEYPDLSQLEAEAAASYARGLCAYAEALENAPSSDVPLYGDLVASSATSWGVSVAVVEDVIRATNLMCPRGFDTLQKIDRSEEGLALELEITGSGAATVSYTLPDGASQSDRVTVPWQQTIYLPEVMTTSLSVAPDEGAEAGCRIRIGSDLIAEKRPSASPVTCDATDRDIDRASVEQ
jgi:hypothetical protein